MPVVISRAFSVFVLHKHSIDKKKSFSGDVNYEANFPLFFFASSVTAAILPTYPHPLPTHPPIPHTPPTHPKARGFIKPLVLASAHPKDLVFIKPLVLPSRVILR